MLPSLLVGGNPSGYIIPNSLRFQSASSQYLSRTFGTPTATNVCTISAWVKRGGLGGFVIYGLNVGGSTNDTSYIGFDANDKFVVSTVFGGVVKLNLVTTQVFRDPSAWYHFVISLNATAGTAVIYVNGQQITSFSTSTMWSAASTGYFNTSGNGYAFGSRNIGEKFDGYLSEVNFIDGQALTPSSFGTTDPTSGQWVAKKYAGTYGTNGFYLPFSNGTSTTTLGNDSSGNGNNWTLTNFTRSAGVSDCWMYDVPSGNGGASGTQPNSNYSVVNPLEKRVSGVSTTSNANLTANVGNAGSTEELMSSVYFPTSGKWYWEVTVTTVSTISRLGICQAQETSAFFNSSYLYDNGGTKYVLGTNSAYGASYTSGDVISFAFDADAGTLTAYKNNATQGTLASSLTNSAGYKAIFTGKGAVQNVNFGQRSFAYTPPTGFKALCTANLPVASIKQGNKYMDATLYTGNGTGQSIVNAAPFKPDFVWVKKRGGGVSAQWHMLADSVRGTGTTLSSNVTDAEYTGKTSITAFNSNGFTLGADSTGASYYGWNIASETYVGWQWQAGQGSTSSNTNGSITSTVSVNATAGFSVVTYTGTGALATVGHGLGVAPKMIIIKQRTNAGLNWAVYHASIPSAPLNVMYLNLTNAGAANNNLFNSTAPTSSVFTVNTGSDVNQSGAGFVAYCFAEIAGYSKAFSYTGNGSSDGTFVYLGFRPKWIMIKMSSGAENWFVFDSVRGTYNDSNPYLLPNTSAAEGAFAAPEMFANGFKWNSTSTAVNGSGSTYIGFAFAESPFQNSNAR